MRFERLLLVSAIFGFLASGCELVASADRDKIPRAAGGAPSTSSGAAGEGGSSAHGGGSQGGGGSAQGGGGSAQGGGGAGGGCTSPTSCPGMDTECQKRTCVD